MPYRPATILMVIPQARLRDIYNARAEREGFEVEQAQNLLDAERRAVSFRPSVLIVAAELIDDPKLFMKHLRSLPSLAKARVMIVASSLSAEAIRNFTASGIKDVILTLHQHPSDIFKYIKTTTV